MRFSKRLQRNQIANGDLADVTNKVYVEKSAKSPISSEGMGITGASQGESKLQVYLINAPNLISSMYTKSLFKGKEVLFRITTGNKEENERCVEEVKRFLNQEDADFSCESM